MHYSLLKHRFRLHSALKVTLAKTMSDLELVVWSIYRTLGTSPSLGEGTKSFPRKVLKKNIYIYISYIEIFCIDVSSYTKRGLRCSYYNRRYIGKKYLEQFSITI